MSHRITIELLDDVFGLLQRTAAEVRIRTEVLAARWLDAAAEPDDDPLLSLAGIIESTMSDVSKRHDEYLGAAIAPPPRAEQR
ncbi:MAG TPA: hypothetical protein VFJ58_19240 [Armatimonadota bacterium]|nr:hypothetical protein [Armatimonadota bacterium]